MSGMQPNIPSGASLLQATIRQLAPHIATSDNLGGTDDFRDLYHLLDYLAFAVDKAYPEIPCAKGCSHCCNNQVFRVSAAEWAVVSRGLDALGAPVREAILANALAVYGPHEATLQAMADAWSAGEKAGPDLHTQAPTTCPMLIGGRCSVYAERPAICRGYGYFSATIDDTPLLLICQQEGPDWIQHLEQTGVDQLPMPTWNPVQRRIDVLNGARAVKPLPLWLLERGRA